MCPNLFREAVRVHICPRNFCTLTGGKMRRKSLRAPSIQDGLDTAVVAHAFYVVGFRRRRRRDSVYPLQAVFLKYFTDEEFI